MKVQERAQRLGVNWWTMRLVVSADLPDGLLAVRRDYTYADTLEAHLALDALDESREIMDREAKKAAKRKSKSRR